MTRMFGRIRQNYGYKPQSIAPHGCRALITPIETPEANALVPAYRAAEMIDNHDEAVAVEE